MTEGGSIIIDGRTIVVSGQVGDDRAKATVLRDIAPLTQAGLELEDRILAGPSSAGPSKKAPSPKVPFPSGSPIPKGSILAEGSIPAGGPIPDNSITG